MSNNFQNVPFSLSAASIQQDVSDLLKWNKRIQRYSTARDSFVTLSREFDEFVMKDSRTGYEHRLSVDYTGADRLTPHWSHFAHVHAANI